ncbi:MAG: membrane dipeptidase [Eubacteriales bacterium]|nr:membrane dipeptidase [Eubacteriales bacterium]
MRYCDLHCDTATALYDGRLSIADAPLCVSIEKARCLDKYYQAMAIFTSTRFSDDEGWQRFWRVREKLLWECAMYRIPLLADCSALNRFRESDRRIGFVLTVEDGRILDNHIDRVQSLFDAGVRILTPLWGGETCIGGSHQSEKGLSDFGKAAVRECFRLGIAVDLSHASERSADEILDMAEETGGKVLATHSNAHAICAHTRNLTDERIQRLASLGGVIGINLYTAFLKPDGPWSITDMLPHIDHIANLVGTQHIAIGADWDGAEFPPDCTSIADIPYAAQILREHGYSDTDVDGILCANAVRFLQEALTR